MSEQSKVSRYARTSVGYYDLSVILFVTLLIVANICATKLIQLGGLIFDGGALTFPLTYILGDVISEIYGFKASKRAIIFGFWVSLLVTFIFLIVAYAPPAPDYPFQEDFMNVFGFVPRIVLASLIGYVVGECSNAYVLVWIKDHFSENHLWVRLVSSTLVGEFLDTLIFCTVAFAGEIGWGDFTNYVIVGYIYKVAVEVCFLPITYRVIGYVKKVEIANGNYQPLSS